MRSGITCGKFMPFHRGHELMIDFAAAVLDHVVVMVAGKETDTVPLSLRYKWVAETYKGNPKVSVISFHDDITYVGEPDADGTIHDPIFWEKWVEAFRKAAPDATHFFSSDMYGKVAAEKLGIEWLPVDPDREMVHISGTKIRQQTTRNFDYLTLAAKKDLVKKVVVIGPESTGKSTLTAKLAEHFKTSFANEWGRTVCLAKNKLTETDFENIAVAQQTLIDIAIKNSAGGVVFSDTEAYTTYLFGRLYLNKNLEAIRQRAINQKFDLYVLLAPTVEWIQDGTRTIDSQIAREKFFNDLYYFLVKHKKPFVVVDNDNFEDRTNEAIDAVQYLLTKDELMI
jgi:HTH-type transcriptional repressor of NAD biosynthesis genes